MMFFFFSNHDCWCVFSDLKVTDFSDLKVMVSLEFSVLFLLQSLVFMCRTVAGEFCGNGRNFFQKLSDRSDLALNDMSLVFETRNVMVFWSIDG